MTERVCGNCRFYVDDGDAQGACHRYAPRPVWGKDIAEDAKGTDWVIFWPDVRASDRCGEWKE